MMRHAAISMVLLATLLTPAVANAAQEPRALFALVVGSNRSVDADKAPLRYADDDAARYFDLYRALGARVHLLSRLDHDTKRLHTQAAAEARHPTAASWTRATRALVAEMQRAKERGLRTELHVVFAGHGDEHDGQGVLELEDRRLSGQDVVDDVVDPAGAGRTHVIVDACDSFAFAYAGSRGPGGTRRPAEGFSRGGALGSRSDVGLLLSSSATRETHEWEVVQAGVFSHVLRSGMLGAADADADGHVSYREIAAFVERAAVAIPNARYRPHVHVDPPEDAASELLDLSPAMGRRLETSEAATPGHHFVENTLGVRLADFHAAPGQKVRLIRPPSFGRVYVRQTGSDSEYDVPAEPDVVCLWDRERTRAQATPRGAAHHAFEHLFALPFGARTVAGFDLVRAETEPPGTPGEQQPHELALGYELGNGYLRDAGLRHGGRLSYRHTLGRLRLGAAVSYAASAYEWQHKFEVLAHELGACLLLDGVLFERSWLRLSLGVETGGGWTWQRGEARSGLTHEGAGWFLRYRGVATVAFPFARRFAFFVRGGAGQTVFRSDGRLHAPFDAGLTSGLSLRL